MASRVRAQVSFILHATEDPEKFFAAFKEYGLDRADFESSNHTGHFDNTIMLWSASPGPGSDKLVKSTIQKMNMQQIQSILDDIKIYVSDSALYLRFDRQEFVQGRLALSQSNPVKIRIILPTYGRTDPRVAYADLLRSYLA